MMEALQRALRPLSQPPAPPGWNHALMTELIGEIERRPAAVLIGLRDANEPHMIFTVRTDHLSSHAGQVAFPGGSADPTDADALTTALRESEEEIGLHPSHVTPLGYLDCFETISGFCITPVVARIANQAQFRPAPDEVAEVFEVPLTFFLEPSNLKRYQMDYRGRRREMVEFHYQGHRIWGATAAILQHLLQKMEQA
ncbi:hypothetical protein GCM10007901_41690 [Dyella acidisoli]|uniref:Nudix hydrolase domain-containing protein n=1 Tax=Dyella acidisoli TaxID=1867834 RepID=A0ABQ5XVX4_9GAMM|nr:CoA pyrophosphatase [Dyella acidisoli]GLQ95214.1 hypothetical protein GCM10007901_41690 [Dyella acidisoli]